MEGVILTSEPSETPADEFLFEFVLYLIASARLSLDELPVLGSFRLVEAAGRIIDVAERIPGLHSDDFLRDIRATIERSKMKVMLDREGYLSDLTDVATSLAAEAVRRSLEKRV